MWSFFSRDPIKDFAYEIGPQVAELNEKSLWSLHHGKRKSNGDSVSIFVYEGKAGNDSQLMLIKAAFKRVKTLRHPNFIIYLDGLETEKSCYIVTEPITPLITYLDEQLNDEKGPVQQLVISWGLHQLAKGLSFLINDCNLVHNNVNLSSVFVDQAGEWKLGGMEYSQTCGGSQDPFTPIIKGLPYLEKYDPPEKITKKPGEKWSSDMWGLGCLTWEVFNGPFVKSTSLKNPGKIPKSLIPNYCELVGANPKSRPNPNKFIESCRAPDGFMNNKFVTTMLFLEEIQIQDNEAKVQFFNGLTQIVDLFPTSFCKQKILPQLLHAFEYGNVGSSVLAPLFKLGKLLSTEEYQKKMVPCVVKLFSSTDRTTRVKLLQQIESFAEHLSPQVVNDQIFPSIVSGFMDSNPVVREQTIKSMLHLACKLNYKNLNEELLKHFARLQSKDDQGGIRTNTTVCLGKVACYLHPQVRQRVLSSAFLRALKDPFPPARQAGILAMSATHNFFTLQESSQRLLPALCQMSMDPDKTVRDQVFRSIKCFLGKLEKVSENPDLLAEVEKEVNAGGLGATNTSGWAGWAVSGMTSLTSKIYSSKKGPQTTVPTPISAAAAATTTATTAATSSAVGALKAASNSTKKVEIKKSNPGQSAISKSTYKDDDDEDGEDDRSDYGNDDVIVKDNHNHGTAAADDDDGEEVGWGDQEWGDMEVSL
ncbi:hypothetical protein HELRODRAFT_72072 [Helobdella robusta]|uniref:N-terminal kinase-like protein n=1 Tax=Helobdella robusta TaxID=6412 RepID=T1G0V0_HELRO|nr:hypothetical protein HELRODRAFT_72072 [Helobdella robusta]ESO10592.1 hypothetical protein HELRODRAFT_72072 [Helobdella robusta]